MGASFIGVEAWSAMNRMHSVRASSSPCRAHKARTLPEWVQKGLPQRRSKGRRNKSPSTTTGGPVARVPLPASQLLQFERDGHTTLKAHLDPVLVGEVQGDVARLTAAGELDAWRQRVRVLCPGVDVSRLHNVAQAQRCLASHANEPVGFLQYFNTRRSSPAVNALVQSPALAGAACDLLGCNAVRVYQDCLFVKQPGMSETNWHSDLRMTVLDTNRFLTAWTPLRAIKADGDSGLLFASQSHRDVALMFWHEPGSDLSTRGYPTRGTGAMAVGDVSVHHGWCLHMAPGQAPGTQPRAALAISYFADGARVHDWDRDPSLRKHLRHHEDAESYESWYPSLRSGDVARHADIPIVYRVQS